MKHHPSWTALRSYVITAGLACLMGVSYELFVFPNAFAPAGIGSAAPVFAALGSNRVAMEVSISLI